MRGAGSIDIVDACRRLLGSTASARFAAGEVEDLPEPVRRYFNAAIAPGSPLATTATISMRGHIKFGRWLPFRAEEVLAPTRGFVWRARAVGVISGFDAYIDGHGAMQWKLLGLATVMHAEGDDVTRSAAGRCVGEGIWLPTALLPRFGVAWTAPGADHIVAAFDLDTTRVEVHCHIDTNGYLTSVVFDRWGDPDETGTHAWHPFGGDIDDHRTFNGITVPSTGSWGWFHGTSRWGDGEFFRCDLTDHNLR